MFEGFLEMQSVVSRVHGRLNMDGEQEYRKIEFSNERRLHTPNMDRSPVLHDEEQPWRTDWLGKWRSH
ncbi:hypothetical protein [Paenibacillus senegalimassiliensis]|uniref:hypothetical protein n=1 Tax=Paenibacillus senegalimassiliensis TaxID=1737426 RepID=UPI000AFBCB87|nr:hypothetical protein [Paenibacillus senegalimassiliensis]